MKRKKTVAKTNKETKKKKKQVNCDGKHCCKQNKTFHFT